MASGAHLLFSWLSTVEFLPYRRERRIVTLAGLAPDLDGFGIIIDKITNTTHYYEQFHHYLGHSIVSAFLFTVIATTIANTHKWRVAVLTFFVVHLHILCDVVGSRGLDGYQWPIYYLYPFNPDLALTWTGQWLLGGWQNQVIIGVLLCACLYYAIKQRYSFIEVISSRLDQEAFAMFYRYWKK